MIVCAQIDGQMAVAVLSLESATHRCVNCDVYGWKQVVDFLCHSFNPQCLWLDAGGGHKLSPLLPPLQPADVLLPGVPGGALG